MFNAPFLLFSVGIFVLSLASLLQRRRKENLISCQLPGASLDPEVDGSRKGKKNYCDGIEIKQHAIGHLPHA
jgi:hypothetical protein